jgi:protein CpxP
MKKLIYTVALVVMGITASYAQGKGGPRRPNETPEQRAEKVATELQTKLSLTANQKQKVQALELERIRKNEEWRKSDEGDRKGKMEERKTFMKASKDKMDAILTAEQKTKMEAARKEMKDKMKDGRGHGARGEKGPKGPKGEKTPPPPPPANN